MYDYRRLKEFAKESKRPVTDFIALAPQNDPFYTGTERDRALGRWFADLWQMFGYRSGVHIRRMHYAVVSQNPPIRLPNGELYENTEKCWDELNMAAKAARYLQFVDPGAFVDRRNEDPQVHIDFWTEHEVDIGLEEAESREVRLPDPPAGPHYTINTFSTPQRYHIEVWVEKSTMNDILSPLVRRYAATLLFGKGELSITAALQAVERFKQSEKPVRIFYVSDFDPAGASMPVAMSRKLEYFVRREELDLDIKLFPIALTYAQTKYYSRLLPTPIKESERRRASFEAKYGAGAIELDALEALYPGELHRLVEQEILRYYDSSLSERLNTAHRALRHRLERLQRDVYSDYANEIANLDEEWQAICQELEETFQSRIAQNMERRKALYQEIQEALEEQVPVLDEDDLPEAEEAEERNGALYDSARDYLTQNECYQAHKRNMSSSA